MVGTNDDISIVDAVSEDVAWFVGPEASGRVFRTEDGGATFEFVRPAGFDSFGIALDVEASTADKALLLSGEDAESRIYRTSDGGATWRIVLRTSDSPYYDSLYDVAMFDPRHGFAVGTRERGDGESQFYVVVTRDGGRTWDEVDEAAIPPALDGEAPGGIGTSAAATGHKGFFSTDAGRVFRSADRGLTWDVSPVSSGDFVGPAMDFRTNRLGLAVGENVSRTIDGGVTWQPVEDVPGVFSKDVAWWNDRRGDERSTTDAQRTVLLPRYGAGSLVSRDGGLTWTAFDSQYYLNVDCVEASPACWAVGGGTSQQRIAKLTVTY